MNEPEKTFLSIPEAARRSGLSRYQLRNLCREKAIPCLQSGKRWRVDYQGMLAVLRREMGGGADGQ